MGTTDFLSPSKEFITWQQQRKGQLGMTAWCRCEEGTSALKCFQRDASVRDALGRVEAMPLYKLLVRFPLQLQVQFLLPVPSMNSQGTKNKGGEE